MPTPVLSDYSFKKNTKKTKTNIASLPRTVPSRFGLMPRHSCAKLPHLEVVNVRIEVMVTIFSWVLIYLNKLRNILAIGAIFLVNTE